MVKPALIEFFFLIFHQIKILKNFSFTTVRCPHLVVYYCFEMDTPMHHMSSCLALLYMSKLYNLDEPTSYVFERLLLPMTIAAPSNGMLPFATEVFSYSELSVIFITVCLMILNEKNIVNFFQCIYLKYIIFLKVFLFVLLLQ